MLKSRSLRVIAVAVGAAVAACGEAHERATTPVPGVPDSRVSLAIERTSNHGYLTEYRRPLIVALDGRESARLEMLPDTGGYSRTNLYRLSNDTVFLRDAFESYTVDVNSGAVSKDEKRRVPAVFVGSFDVDAAGKWSFIPASERTERPTELAGGS
jgi:hypothetical protein